MPSAISYTRPGKDNEKIKYHTSLQQESKRYVGKDMCLI